LQITHLCLPDGPGTGGFGFDSRAVPPDINATFNEAFAVPDFQAWPSAP
jgi:hypothetical protein